MPQTSSFLTLSIGKTKGSSIWTFWYARILAVQGKPEKALKEADREKDPSARQRIRTMVLREVAHHSGEWQPLIDHLEACFRATQAGEFLFELCEIKARREEWSYVADLADSLIRLVETADALRLAAYCSWNAQRPQQCLQLLRENRHLFPENFLPNDLQRLQVLCQARLGFVSQAVADAEELVHQEDTTENILTLMDLQLRRGDLKGLAITARRLALREKVSPEDLLRVARLVAFEDPELAKEFWYRVRADVENDLALLNETLSLGFRLGLDAEMASLIKRGQEFATQGKGSFQAVDLESLSSVVRDHAVEVTRVVEKYDQGEVLIHAVVEKMRIPLVVVFHTVAEENRRSPNPRAQPILLVRHGGRPLQEQLVKSCHQWRLHLDVTALLLAANLTILERIEQSFAPLRIAPGLPAALVHQLDMLAPPQPSVLTSYRQILQLLRDGKVQPIPQCAYDSVGLSDLVEKMGARWVATLGMASNEGGVMVDFLPLRSNSPEMAPVSLPEEYREHITNCRAVVEGLRRDGHFSESIYDKALLDLGSEGVVGAGSRVPISGTKIFLMKNTASVLADANVLEVVCRHFQTFVDTELLNEARRAVEEEERRSETRIWLGQLIDRVRASLDNGTYECISLPDGLQSSGAERERTANPDIFTLATLLRYTPQAGDVLWVDDRWVNGHAQRDGVPIIGVNEVLHALLHRGAIQEDEYYENLLKLRAANMRYIPLDAKEIRYHLKQAQVVNNAVVETEELSILRRYIAACLLDSARLQRPPMPEGVSNPYGEIAFVIGTLRAVTDAIVAGWLDEDSSDDLAVAHADWLRENLYTGWFGVRHLRPDPDPNSGGLDLIGLDIGIALAQGVSSGAQPRRKDERASPRHKFFEWLESRLIARRLKADPDVVVAIADMLKKLLAGMVDGRDDNPEFKVAAQLALQGFFLDLPQKIQDAVRLDPEVMSRLGLTSFASVNIGSLRFEWAEFVEAAALAVNGRKAQIRSRTSVDEVLLTASDDGTGRRVIEIRDQKGTIIQSFSDLMIDLLLDDTEARKARLQSERLWFDCHSDEFEKLLAEIVSDEKPYDRIERAHAWLGTSAAMFYANLEQKLRDAAEISREDLIPPSAVSLLRHFRLERSVDSSGDFLDALHKAAAALVKDEGLEVAITRLGCLPVRLPSVVMEEFDKLSSEDRQKLCGQLAARWASPICRLHLIDLTLRYAQSDPVLFSMARLVISELFDEEKSRSHYRLFMALLGFVNDEFGYWAESGAWPASAKLAMVWAHASRLHNIFIAARGLPVPLAQWFEVSRRHVSTEIFGRDSAFWNDVLHPRRINPTVLLVHGVAAILAGYDTNIVDALGVRDLLLTAGFTEKNGKQLPRVELLHDPVLAGNALGSFLGGDRSEVLAPCVDIEAVGMLASPTLQGVVREAMQNLRSESSQPMEWAKIAAVVEGLPMYKDLDVEFRELLGTIDFGMLHAADPVAASAALNIASIQIAHLLDEDLRSRCKAGRLEIVRTRATNGGESAEDGTADLLLLDMALMLSIRTGDPRGTTEAFAKLVQEMLAIWPRLARSFRPVLLRLIEELPARYLHGLWPVVLQIRTCDG